MTSPDFRPPPQPGWWVKGNRPVFGGAGALTFTGGVGGYTIGSVITGGGATLTITGATGAVTTGRTVGGGGALTLTGGVGRWVKTMFGGAGTLRFTGGVGAVGAQYGDDFGRADSSTSLGANWTNRLNVMGIQSNMAYGVTALVPCVATYNPTMIYDNMKVSVVLATPVGGGRDYSLWLGANTTGEGVKFVWDESANDFIIYSTTTWSTQFTRDTNIFGVAPSLGDLIEFQRVGNVYTAFRNGGQVCTWTDSSNVVPRDSSHRLVGVGAVGGTSNYARISSWSAVNI